jgi:hypothetical protein
MCKYATAVGVDIERFSLRIDVVNMDGDILPEENVTLKEVKEREEHITVLHARPEKHFKYN